MSEEDETVTFVGIHNVFLHTNVYTFDIRIQLCTPQQADLWGLRMLQFSHIADACGAYTQMKEVDSKQN